MSIRHEPAECWKNCDDKYCPYIHWDGWYVISEIDGQEYGPFNTKDEAIEVNKRHMLPDDR